MSFYKKYELQRLAHEGEAKVFRATQTATGLEVFLHVFPVNDTTRDLAAEVQRRLAAGPAHDLLETGEFAGAIYVVTSLDDAIRDLRAYLQSHAAGAVAPPPPAPSPEPFWIAPQPSSPPVPTPAPPVQSAPPPPPPTPVPPVQPPRSSVQNHPTVHGQEATPTPVETRRRRRTTEIISHGTVTVGKGPAESSKSEPGEFTRIFCDAPPAKPPGPPLSQSPSAPAPFPPVSTEPTPPPMHAPASSGPGEFTRLFSGQPQTPSGSSFTGMPPQPPAQHTSSPYGAPHPPQQPLPQQQVPPAPRDQEMAEFERIFGPAGGRPFPADEAPAKPPPASTSPLPSWPQAPPHPSPQGYQQPPTSQHGGGEFTRFFGNNFSGDPIDVEREQKRAAAEPVTPPRRPFQKASEFTQMFGPGALESGAPSPPPPRSTANWADQSGAYSVFDPRLNTPQPNTRRRTADLTQQVGPSEYTRMISGGGAGMPGAGLNQDSPALKSGPMAPVNPKQVPGQQVSAAPSKAGQIGLYVAIGGILIALIVALVLLLTSK